MSNIDWTFIIQLNGESDLMDSMIDTFNTIKTNFDPSSSVEYFVIFDGWKDSTLSANPKLYQIIEKTDIIKPDKIFDFTNLADEGNIKKLLNEVWKRKHQKSKYIAYFIRDHGGGMYLSTNNAIYSQIEIKSKDNNKDPQEEINNLKNKFGIRYKDTSYKIEIIHRGGAEYRAIIEKQQKKEKYLTVLALANAITTSEFKKVDILCLDCCWGQMIENTIHLKDACKFFIANEDQGAIAGIGYDRLTSYVNKTKLPIRIDEMVNSICANYILSNQHDYWTQEDFFTYGVCLSAVNTEKIDVINSLFNKFVQGLMKQLLGSEKESFAFMMFQVRKKCFDFLYEGRIPDKDGEYSAYVIDLINFLQFLRESAKDPYPEVYKQASDLLIELLASLKVERSNYKLSTIDYGPQGNGISIFFPISLVHWKNSDMYVQPDNMLTMQGASLQSPFEYYSGWPLVLNAFLNLPPNSNKETRDKLNQQLESKLFKDLILKENSITDNALKEYQNKISGFNLEFANKINEVDKTFLSSLNKMTNDELGRNFSGNDDTKSLFKF